MIELERDGEVFVLRLKSDENRLNQPFLDELARVLDEVEASEGNAALVTTGEGKFYSNGLDLAWAAGRTGDEIRKAMAGVHALFARLLAFPVATVAAINGHAFAAGAMLALAHDFRAMRADRGYFCFPEIDLGTGLPLTPGMYALLAARLSPATAHEALITGRRYDATEAVARQMVHEALREAEALPRAIEIARGLASKDRATMAALKRGMFASALEALSQPVPEFLAAGRSVKER
jgi:enoyl-CoA hydratase/carnithine racemase